MQGRKTPIWPTGIGKNNFGLMGRTASFIEKNQVLEGQQSVGLPVAPTDHTNVPSLRHEYCLVLTPSRTCVAIPGYSWVSSVLFLSLQGFRQLWANIVARSGVSLAVGTGAGAM